VSDVSRASPVSSRRRGAVLLEPEPRAPPAAPGRGALRPRARLTMWSFPGCRHEPGVVLASTRRPPPSRLSSRPPFRDRVATSSRGHHRAGRGAKSQAAAKPFPSTRRAAGCQRTAVMLRRTMRPGQQWTFEGFRLDPDDACRWRGTELICLQPTTFDVLHHLVAHAGRLVTKQRAAERVRARHHRGRRGLDRVHGRAAQGPR
jgi:hypothetical protein